MPSNSGNYEDIIGWTDFATIWNDLEPDFENEAPDAREEDGEKNTLVRFLKEKTAKSWAPLAQEIAKLRGVLFSELFPFYAAADVTEGAVQKRRTAEDIEVPDHCDLCNHDTYNVGTYSVVEDKYYFQLDRKYSEGCCNECKQWFSTEANTKNGWCPQLSLPSTLDPAYVCKGMYMDLSCCGIMMCSTCYAKKQGSSSHRSRRRA